MPPPNVDQRELERETVRLTERYVSEVVLEHELCPWAEPALRRGRVQISVITDLLGTGDLRAAARICCQRLLDTALEIDLVLLVLPRFAVRRLDMDTLLAVLREEMAQREGVASFALAAFHPEAEPDPASGERFIPFLRRSPDPLVQAVRFTALEQLGDKPSSGTTFLDPMALDQTGWSKAPVESLRSRIARRNLEHVLDVGLDAMQARLDDICADRKTTHRRLGLID